MDEPSPHHPSRSAFAAAAPWAVALVVAALGVATWQVHRSLGQLGDRVGAIESSLAKQSDLLQLLRFEQRSKQGLGMSALLDQLRFWGDQYENSGTPTAERPAIKERLLGIVDAMRAVEGAVPELERAFFATPETAILQREWLLRAIDEIAPQEGLPLLERTVRALDFVVATPTRLFAARELRRLDAKRAAATLREVLNSETAVGVNADRLTADQRAQLIVKARLAAGTSGFFNFVEEYSQCGDPDAAATLLALLRRRNEQDLLTLQATVKALGDLHATDAAPAIRDLFENPPRDQHPMFLNHCLDALAAIEGPAAEPYFQAKLQIETNALVKSKLGDLLKKLGG